MRRSLLSICIVFGLGLSQHVSAIGSEDCPSEPQQNDAIARAVLAIVPHNWNVVQKSQGEIPEGHYWCIEYKGQRGELIVLEGPQEVMCRWTDREDGHQHREPLAEEVLKLWIMPSGYSDSWKRFFNPHRPVRAIRIYSGAAGKLYAKPSHRITDKRARFDEILGQASMTGWPDSPGNGGSLSWATWKKDLARAVEAAARGCPGKDGQVSQKEPPLAQDQSGNFVLYVCNKSFAISPVDISISIDGRKAVSADFAVKHQHNLVEHVFQLAPGKHKLVAVSKKGAAQLETEFEVSDKHWAVVDYWCNPKQGEKRFSFHIQDTQIGFM
jgi:hypothetical protein